MYIAKGNSLRLEESGMEKSTGDEHKKQTILPEEIKTFFKFVVLKVILLNKKIMHVEQVRISHVSDLLCDYSFHKR